MFPSNEERMWSRQRKAWRIDLKKKKKIMHNKKEDLLQMVVAFQVVP